MIRYASVTPLLLQTTDNNMQYGIGTFLMLSKKHFILIANNKLEYVGVIFSAHYILYIFFGT